MILLFIPSHKRMIVEPMVKPSSLLSDGISLSEFGNIQIFRFTDELQDRLESLLEKSKAGLLTSEEQSEWAGITELSRILGLWTRVCKLMIKDANRLYNVTQNYRSF